MATRIRGFLCDDSLRSKYEKECEEYMKTEQLQFKDEQTRKFWDNLVEANSESGYSSCVIYYAEHWAKFMQYFMTKYGGVEFTQIVREASDATGINRTTGNILVGSAVKFLSRVWKHGEELQKWYDNEYGL